MRGSSTIRPRASREVERAYMEGGVSQENCIAAR
jgi:hypothetical protein